MPIKTVARWLVASCVLMFPACSATSPTAPLPPVANAGLRILFGQIGCKELRSGAGGGSSFDVYTVDTDGVYQRVSALLVSWSSSDPAVARGQSGAFADRFVFIAPGAVEVRGTYQGMAAAIPFIVHDRTLPYLEVDAAAVNGGRASARLRTTATGATTDVTSAATFMSTNPAVVKLDGTRITIGAAGSSEIRATYNGLTGGCGLSVYPLLYRP